MGVKPVKQLGFFYRGGFVLLLEIVFTCRNVMGRRFLRTQYKVMCDVRQAHQQGGR